MQPPSPLPIKHQHTTKSQTNHKPNPHGPTTNPPTLAASNVMHCVALQHSFCPMPQPPMFKKRIPQTHQWAKCPIAEIAQFPNSANGKSSKSQLVAVVWWWFCGGVAVVLLRIGCGMVVWRRFGCGLVRISRKPRFVRRKTSSRSRHVPKFHLPNFTKGKFIKLGVVEIMHFTSCFCMSCRASRLVVEHLFCETTANARQNVFEIKTSSPISHGCGICKAGVGGNQSFYTMFLQFISCVSLCCGAHSL